MSWSDSSAAQVFDRKYSIKLIYGIRRMITAKALLSLTFSIYIVCLSALASSSNSDNSSTWALETKLRSKDEDQIVATLNDLKKERLDKETLDFLVSIWKRRVNEHPAISWGILETDTVMLEVVDLLAQAEANKQIRIAPEELREYVLLRLDRDDQDIVIKSILILPIFDNDEDAKKILSIARTAQSALFRASVISLSRMCNSTAERSLEEIEKVLTDGMSRDFLDDTVSSMMKFKQDSSLCGW